MTSGPPDRSQASHPFQKVRVALSGSWRHATTHHVDSLEVRPAHLNNTVQQMQLHMLLC